MSQRTCWTHGEQAGTGCRTSSHLARAKATISGQHRNTCFTAALPDRQHSIKSHQIPLCASRWQKSTQANVHRAAPSGIRPCRDRRSCQVGSASRASCMFKFHRCETWDGACCGSHTGIKGTGLQCKPCMDRAKDIYMITLVACHAHSSILFP